MVLTYFRIGIAIEPVILTFRLFVSLSVYLSRGITPRLFIFLPKYLFVCLFVHVSVSLLIHFSV